MHETTLENVAEVMTNFNEYIRKRDSLYNNIKLGNKDLGNVIKGKFYDFSHDKSFKKAYDLTRIRQNYQITESALSSYATLMEKAKKNGQNLVD